MTCKKDAKEKPTAGVQKEVFRRDPPVERFLVQNSEVSETKSNTFVSRKGMYINVPPCCPSTLEPLPKQDLLEEYRPKSLWFSISKRNMTSILLVFVFSISAVSFSGYYVSIEPKTMVL